MSSILWLRFGCYFVFLRFVFLCSFASVFVFLRFGFYPIPFSIRESFLFFRESLVSFRVALVSFRASLISFGESFFSFGETRNHRLFFNHVIPFAFFAICSSCLSSLSPSFLFSFFSLLLTPISFVLLMLTHPAATLFINPIVSYILYSSGNIPVDRKSKDQLKLFKGGSHSHSRLVVLSLRPGRFALRLAVFVSFGSRLWLYDFGFGFSFACFLLAVFAFDWRRLWAPSFGGLCFRLVVVSGSLRLAVFSLRSGRLCFLSYLVAGFCPRIFCCLSFVRIPLVTVFVLYFLIHLRIASLSAYLQLLRIPFHSSSILSRPSFIVSLFRVLNLLFRVLNLLFRLNLASVAHVRSCLFSHLHLVFTSTVRFLDLDLLHSFYFLLSSSLMLPLPSILTSLPRHLRSSLHRVRRRLVSRRHELYRAEDYAG